MSSFAFFSIAVVDFFPQKGECYAGGNSLNQAVRMALAGESASFVGALGSDEPGNYLLDILTVSGVDTRYLCRIDGATATNQLVNDSLGERTGVPGSWCGGVADTYLLNEEQWLFLCAHDKWSTQLNSPNFEEAIRRKPAATHLHIDALHLPDYEKLEKYARHLSVVFVGGEASMLSNLERLARRVPCTLVLTLGAEGSVAFRGRKFWSQEALPVAEVLDTTGCGDAFQAGFALSMQRADDIALALLQGAEWGRAALAHYGGVSSP